MRIYISGPISGVPGYYERFDRAARQIRRLGHTPVNPARHPAGLSRREYMRMDLADLMACDAVYMLPGWISSGGAMVERALARYLDMKIFYRLEEIPDESEPVKEGESWQPSP